MQNSDAKILIYQLDAAIRYRFIACRLNTAHMFRASLCPTSGAYQLQQQPLVYRWSVVVAVLLVVVGPAGPITTNSTATTTPLR
jgi:hypothetical protein